MKDNTMPKPNIFVDNSRGEYSVIYCSNLPEIQIVVDTEDSFILTIDYDEELINMPLFEESGQIDQLIGMLLLAKVQQIKLEKERNLDESEEKKAKRKIRRNGAYYSKKQKRWMY
jgi:hypothetical protein